MSRRAARNFDPDTGPAAKAPSGGAWVFGAVYAALVLVGFGFGVWAGKPKPVAVAEVKKDNTDKPADKGAPPVAKPSVEPKTREPEPKAKEPEPKAKPPEPKPKEPEPKAKTPDPKSPEPKKVEVRAVAFKEVVPVFRAYCNNCHGAAGKPKGGVDLRTVAAVMKGGENGALVKPGDPEKSLLYLSVKPPSGTMPPDGKPGPTEKELQLVRDWIASGAKERRRRFPKGR